MGFFNYYLDFSMKPIVILICGHDVWLAGSAVSYQWSAAREPGDLDVLIGVDYIQFRKAHPEYKRTGRYRDQQDAQRRFP
jgi:hypothetical protein